MKSRNELNFLILLLIMILMMTKKKVSSSQDITFHLSSLSLENLTLLGDSYIRNGVVGLTRETGVPSSSSGTVIYNTPIPFFDRNTNSTASFSTRFSFSIRNSSAAAGDGLAFFLSPDRHILGSPGGYLGLVNSSQLTKNRFIAIEFDTRLDLHFNDPDDNHVGLDVDSLNSIKTASAGIDLKSGNLITCWIDYWNDGKNLKVFLSESSYKPLNPMLDVDDIDLTQFLQDFMYLGFSASTEGSTDTHNVENWSFTSFGIRHLRTPHNVTDNTVNAGIQVPPDTSSNHKRVGLAVGILGPVFFCAVLVVFGYFSIKKLKGKKDNKTEMNIQAELLTGPKQFSYKELKAATNGFHSSRIIGHGAFGSVYKAVLAASSSSTAAVKRSKHSHEGKTEFLAELSIIACLRHRNLVPLQGWCVEKGELLLVYDFMPYGSIDKVLYQQEEHWSFLKWNHRYNIATGLASVLTYLHQECEQQVIHRDIKASNVMLDANFNARLGDFGLARLMDHNKSPVSTLTAGTMGYLAPEYLQYGKATDKTDVFSYGVVVLEVCCGRRPIEREEGGGGHNKMINLVDWVWELHSKGVICDAVDKRLNNEFDIKEVRKLLLVGLSCANPDSEKRPSMRRVLQILNNEAAEIKVPKQKPMLRFSTSLPLSIEDIMSSSSFDGKKEDDASHTRVRLE
uniref:probable L-type lectin-domain containing receptor kinase S.7 n=1 Tax=Erigeron canadensis TaxID=72917 RepID=UPI001CB8EE2F|nr:probable L-type lectin-domain containing receptor kinase S.7 [Erigeron canadensis]